MKAKVAVAALFVAVISISACFGEKKATTTTPSDGVNRKWTSTKVKKVDTVKLASGIQYIITHKGNGPLPKPAEDRVLALYTGRLVGDTAVFDASSRHGNVPYGFHPGRGGEVIAGWDTAFKYLRGGDRAIIIIPSKYAYGAQSRPGIPPHSNLQFEVEVVDVIPKPVKWDAKGKDTITTPSGLKMIMFESHPDSAQPKKGNMITLDYSGYLLNGFMFDSSVDRGMPFTYQIGSMSLIAGWSEAVSLMREGEKAQVIIPYQLAYGAQGRPPMIPGKSDLVFDMHLINVK